MTIRQLLFIESFADPWDLDTYHKEAMEYHLNGIHWPFWHDWPLLDLSTFFTPEPLHHWHKMFWDHDAKWCIHTIGSVEMNYHFSILHPQTGRDSSMVE